MQPLRALLTNLPATGKSAASNIARPVVTAQCAICDDLGWVSPDVEPGHPQFGKLQLCQCRTADRAQREVARRLTGLGRLADCSFDNFQPDYDGLSPTKAAILNLALETAKRFAGEPCGWLLLTGSYGTGKTHLAAAIANTLLKQGRAVQLVSVPDLLDNLRATFGPDAADTYTDTATALRDAPLLVLDDLGTESATPWAREKLYQIINHRYIHRLPTIITSDVENARLDPRLASRLNDIDLVRKIVLTVPDFRRGSAQVATDHRPWLYDRFTFDEFDVRRGSATGLREQLTAALRAARDFAAQPRGWLAFSGATFTGKTHLAAAIANVRRQRGEHVEMVTAPDLLDELRAGFAPDAPHSYTQHFSSLRDATLLVLDDLGAESATPWAQEKLYQLINHRYVANLPTVFTVGVSPSDLPPRLRSRLLDDRVCRMVVLTGNDAQPGRADQFSLPKPRASRSSGRR